MTTDYSKAYTEVIEIISHFSKEEYSKIPTEKIEFFQNNMDKEYNYNINPRIDLSEQYISREANAILITLFRDYFATEKQKNTLESILIQNQEKLEEERRKKYNPNNIFNKKQEIKEQNIMEELQMVEYKESFFSKLKKYIFKLLHIES